ncbi:MAG: hypothetical protein NWS20_02495 [Rickettsiaceae bacterium]|nr:hypothetical protein [Rickettsiaceae bacterium]MDP4832553.1 hypothetical protein [Rickettsiaceae bacterium]MDP5020205.1 hypothetical protein [Rickettsiaceae bacterium]MDP5082899.1 hypothetical protein [Rickettsiaceae bacterium]
MSKSEFNDIQESMSQASTQIMAQAGQTIIDQIEALSPTVEQREEIANAFESTAKQTETQAVSDISGLSEAAKKALEEQLKKIHIIPEEMRNNISQAGNGLIDQINDLAIEAIGHAKSAAMEVGADIMKQALIALKSTFTELSALVKGEKTQEQALDGIKNAWKEAGKEVLQSAGKAKQSFAEKFSNNQEKAEVIKKEPSSKSHTEKVMASKEAPEASRER